MEKNFWKQKYKCVSQREREKLLETFLEDLDNEDKEDILEDTNLDSDSDTDTGVDEPVPTEEGDLNETVDLHNDVDNVNDNDNDTVNINSNTNEVENENIDFTNMEDVAELQGKAKFRSLDETTNDEISMY